MYESVNLMSEKDMHNNNNNISYEIDTNNISNDNKIEVKHTVIPVSS